VSKFLIAVLLALLVGVPASAKTVQLNDAQLDRAAQSAAIIIEDCSIVLNVPKHHPGAKVAQKACKSAIHRWNAFLKHPSETNEDKLDHSLEHMVDAIRTYVLAEKFLNTPSEITPQVDPNDETRSTGPTATPPTERKVAP
jgi:hypothetical protein